MRKLLGFFVCFQFNCPALLSQLSLISWLNTSGLKGCLCPKYSEKMHILCSHPRILCCFHLTQQNCHDREAVICFWYLDSTYQNSSFAFSLTLDGTWHLKSIIFENVLSVACKIGETRCAAFPKIARQKSLPSTCFFNSALVLVSICCDGGGTSGLSYAEETCSNWFSSAVLQCQ